MSDDRPPEAWERQADESAKAFEAFRIYRDAGASRSLLATSRAFYQKPFAKRPGGRISEWSRVFHWTERATMFDAHLDDIRRDAEIKAEAERAAAWAQRRIDIREQGYDTGQKLLARALEILSLPVTQTKDESVSISDDGQTIIKTTIIEPVGVRARDAALIAKVAIEQARLAAGLETNRTANSFDPNDVAKLSDDQLRAIVSGKPVPQS